MTTPEILPGLMGLHILLTFAAYILGGWRAGVVVFVGSILLAIVLDRLYWSRPTRKQRAEGRPVDHERAVTDGC